MTAIPQAERIHLNLDPAVTIADYAQHRRRFAASVSTLDVAALGTQSRCSEWTNADVLRHCIDVDTWMHAFWNGEDPPFTAFDPMTTPDEWVVRSREVADSEIRDRYVASSERLAAELDETGPERWGAFGISPLGIVPWWLSALHVHWDSWLHERDVLLPLGIEPTYEEGEVVPMLTYGLVVASLFVARDGDEPVDVTIGGIRVQTGAPVVGTPVAGADVDPYVLTDALCGRDSLAAVLAGYDAGTVERFDRLSRLFNPDGAVRGS